MSLLERLAATLAAAVAGMAGVAGRMLVRGWNGTPWLLDLIDAVQGPLRLQAGLVALLMVGLGVYVAGQAWHREAEPQRLRQSTRLGDVTISLRAVESLVYRAARQVKGISEVDARVKIDGEALSVDMSLSVVPDTSMPEVTQAVQERVEEYVRQTVGLPVARVGVDVRGVAREARTRVE
ncbi:MAG: alkaline shock response membrane anchor protein AmaP [Firmicutes bacterium]|nr:alkaline shock response membrane anchor protein AmaP [Bacillota bacterium]